MEGFIFSTVICRSLGRSFLISAIFDSIRCLLRSTFAFQLMKADISQLPRLVMLRMILKIRYLFDRIFQRLGHIDHHLVHRLKTTLSDDLYFGKSDFRKQRCLQFAVCKKTSANNEHQQYRDRIFM